MRMATILLAQRYGSGSAWAAAVGAELRSLRRARGLAQRELASPLTGAYVSSVEHGRAVPSLPALLLLLDRLDVPASAFFEGVNSRLVDSDAR
jgi:transcriptional regulator with XRE-family HTH domain